LVAAIGRQGVQSKELVSSPFADQQREFRPPPLMVGPGTGPMDRRGGVLLWGAGTILLGLTIAFLLAQGQIRAIVLVLLGVLCLLCLAPRRGVFIVLLFLPFMYYLRRQVLYFNEFSQTDPILLFPPVATIAMFFSVLVMHTQRVYQLLRASLLLKLILALAIVFALQIFNPYQGSLLVGIAGGMYFIIPVLWVFLGMILDESQMRKIFMMILVLGTITALYGWYQHYVGFTDVERYELESKNFFKELGDKPRIVSTFASIGDFSLYISVAGYFAFAFYWRNKTRLVYLACIAAMLAAMFWTAVRSSMFSLAFAIVVFLIGEAKRPGRALLRGGAVLIVVAALYGYLYTYTPRALWETERSKNPFVVHTVAGLAHPTEERSFQSRLSNWAYVWKLSFTENALGRGLGSTTLAAVKFTQQAGMATDSYFFELLYGSSLVAAALFIAIVIVFFRDIVRLTLRPGDTFVAIVVFGLGAKYFLGSIFGLDVRDPVGGPLAWLVIGWVIGESARMRESADLGPPAAYE
jgi:hypothetical protein